MKHFQEFLKSVSKDSDSYKKLISFVEEIVNERDEAKKQLQLLENAIRSDYDSIIITTLELDKPGPEIVYVNDGFTRMTGYSKEEAIGETPRMLHGPKTDRAVLDKLRKRLEEGQAFFGHTVNYRKDGSEFINQWDIHPLTNNDGEITHWVSYQHDITERKRSEEKVVDSQVEFDDLAEESKKTLVDLDVQGNIITSNKSFRDLVGYDDDELKKHHFWHFLTDNYVESFKHKFDKFKPSDFDGSTLDLELVNSKGNIVEVKVKTRLLNVDGQQIVRASFQNKSLQKRIMAMLKQRNSDYANMFDADKDFQYKIYKNSAGDFVFKYVSDTFSNITGISAVDVAEMPLKKLIHNDDFAKVANHLSVVYGGKPNTEQYRIKNKDDEYVNVIDYAKPVWNSDRSNVMEVKGSTSTEISSEHANN